MALPTHVIRGKYTQVGVPGSFDAVLYATQQSLSGTQQFDRTVVQDANGADISWLFQNERFEGDYKLTLTGDTGDHALAPAQAVAYSAGTTGAAVSNLGQPFLTPGSVINFTATDPTMPAFSGLFQYQPGASLENANNSPGTLSIKMLKYANSDQQTLMATTPTAPT